MAVPEITDVDLVVVPCAQRETETGRQRWGGVCVGERERERERELELENFIFTRIVV